MPDNKQNNNAGFNPATINKVINLAGTILVSVQKLRFSSKYSDVLRSPQLTQKKKKIMKAIEMNQALMEVIKTTEVLGASALEETRALRQLVASANARIEELETAAVEDAKVCAIEQNGEEKGKFLFDGHHFELRRAETYDFVGKPQKYTMAEGVAFRQKTGEQQVLKAKSAAITKALKAIKDAFPETHPNIEPDSVEFTVVCVD